MKKIIFILFLFVSSSIFAQKNYLIETKDERDTRMQWWRDATFGMFIHWGAYSIPAGQYKGKEVEGIGEWIMHSANIPVSEYEEYVKNFDPKKFNATEWVAIAKNAGVKYIVITSKHHDGFCIWDSKITNYDIMDFSPFKRDILLELSQACKKANIKLCFYHSIMDWHQPDAESKKDYTHQHSAAPNWAKYREEYLKPQLKELIQKYDPAVLWFDGEWVPEWTEEQGRDLFNYLRNLKPSLIINNRIGKGRSGMQGMNKYKDAAGDFGTPEQEILEGTSDSDWESCMTMNDTWGFKTNDHNWKSAKNLIDNLIDIAAKGGNYLLNVGPTSEGLIPNESVERLSEMGKWLKVNGEAIYATRSRKQFKEGEQIRFTLSKDGLYTYVFILNPEATQINLETVSPVDKNIKLLGTGEKLTYNKADKGITIALPKNASSYARVLKIKTA